MRYLSCQASVATTSPHICKALSIFLSQSGLALSTQLSHAIFIEAQVFLSSNKDERDIGSIVAYLRIPLHEDVGLERGARRGRAKVGSLMCTFVLTFSYDVGLIIENETRNTFVPG